MTSTSAPSVTRLRIRVRGTVQGVGFRPFVHRRAVALGLTGWVGNDDDGVLLEIEGAPETLETFVTVLQAEAPPLACIEGIEVGTVPPEGGDRFAISPTRSAGSADVRVSADIAPCDACLAELIDPTDRRYRYPFINCTDCGPRYTIIRRVPYDRPSTTMAGFPMCPRCQAEYDDPADRRFHAQPNACPECGPRLRWSNGRAGDGVGERFGDGALSAAVDCLRAGGIVAVKGVGGFHLACDAGDPSVVDRLRRRKARDDKPFALMVRDLTAAERLCVLTDAARSALTSLRRPVVLVARRPGARVAEAVAPGMPEFGVMLPSSPLHVLLTEALDRPLVMTSGNRSDEPVVHDDAEVAGRLGDIADGFLSHDRPIHIRADDSVLRVTPHGRQQVLRRARGFVPQPIRLPVPAAVPVLAVGAELKSTVAVARRGSVIASHHLGDLEHWATYAAFLQAVEHVPALTGIAFDGSAPAVLAHDLHPEYLSTKWAVERAVERHLPSVAVQHHHAHVAACLVEHGETRSVIGVAFDGLGYGTDGSLWGGEFLLADLGGFHRLAHLRPAALPGGAVAIREPWRMAVSWLDRALGSDAAEEHGRRLDPRWAAVQRLAASGTCPQTSSVGRLLDAVAALLGVRSTISYEGQAPILLEALARSVEPSRAPRYPLSVHDGTLDPAPMLRAVLADLARGVELPLIAAGVHVGLALASADLVLRLASSTGIDTAVLTGGVFANVLLSDTLARRLEAGGLRVLQHAELPPGDGSISIGQAAVAAARGACDGW